MAFRPGFLPLSRGSHGNVDDPRHLQNSGRGRLVWLELAKSLNPTSRSAWKKKKKYSSTSTRDGTH